MLTSIIINNEGLPCGLPQGHWARGPLHWGLLCTGFTCQTSNSTRRDLVLFSAPPSHAQGSGTPQSRRVNIYHYPKPIICIIPVSAQWGKIKDTYLSLCLLQKSFLILSTIEVRGRMLVLFFFLASFSTTTINQSTELWAFRTFCHLVRSSFTVALYTSVS